MLISKCNLFGEGTDPELVRMYLEQVDYLTQHELVDLDSGSLKGSPWWSDTLLRTTTVESRQQLVQAFFDRRNIHADPFILDSLSDDERVKLYKRAIGLGDEQSISLESLLADAEGISMASSVDDLYQAISQALFEKDQWLVLKDMILEVPTPSSIEHDVHQLIWQVRHILMTANGGRSPDYFLDAPFRDNLMEREFLTGKFSQYLWETGSDDIVRGLEEEFLSSKPVDERGQAILNAGYRVRAVFAVQNRNVSDELKCHFYEGLLSHAHGTMNAHNIVPLLKSHQLPDQYFHELLSEFFDSMVRSPVKGGRIAKPEEPDFLEFLDDPRLTSDERDKLLGFNTSLPEFLHNHLKQPDGTYKHAKDLSQDEVVDILHQSTMGFVTPSGISNDYEAFVMAAKQDNISVATLKEMLTSANQKHWALFKNNRLSNEQIKQMLHLFLFADMAEGLNMFMGDSPVSTTVFEEFENNLSAYSTSFPDGERYGRFSLKVCQIYLSKSDGQAEVVSRYLDKHVAVEGLRAQSVIFSSVLNVDIPATLNALLSVVDYRPGYAFELLDNYLGKRPFLDVGKAGDSENRKLGGWASHMFEKVAALTKWAMTREVFPALLQGRDLDPNALEKCLALAVRDCKLDEFDIGLIGKARDSKQFDAVSNLLLANPSFARDHHEAYEALTAELLKRKADACVSPSMVINRPRLGL